MRFGEVRQHRKRRMGLFEIEEPVGLVAPEVLTNKGADPVQGEQEVDGRGRGPGERTHADDPLLPPVVGRKDAGQIADQQGDEPEPDRGLNEGEPDPARRVWLAEPEGRQGGATVLERLLPNQTSGAPEDQGEGDGHQDHPGQWQGHERHRGVHPPQLPGAGSRCSSAGRAPGTPMAKTPCASLGEPSWGRTTVFNADPRTASANTVPATSDSTRRAIIG